jgi:hypothetical protein
MIRRGHLDPGPVHTVAQTKRRPVSRTRSKSGHDGRGV